MRVTPEIPQRRKKSPELKPTAMHDAGENAHTSAKWQRQRRPNHNKS
jgi:hypothetical protein